MPTKLSTVFLQCFYSVKTTLCAFIGAYVPDYFLASRITPCKTTKCHFKSCRNTGRQILFPLDRTRTKCLPSFFHTLCEDKIS